MDNYPFVDRLRVELERLDRRLSWLADEVGRTERWFYNIKDFEKIELGILMKICLLLNTNFLLDYNKWLLDRGQEPIPILGEPEQDYRPMLKKVTINLRLTASANNAEENTSAMLKKIRIEGEKLGFELE
jgi:uncharacterized protein (DUF3820 family)